MVAAVKFWDRFADRYAARPIKDTRAYDAMLADAAGRLKPTDRVLEIGCGTGSIAIRLAPYAAACTATDFSAAMLRIARAKPAPDNLRFVLADAEHAVDGGPFDTICAFQVLHLVDDLPDTLSRIRAQLKPGGLLIAKTWCFADMGLGLRALFLALRAFRLFPRANALTKAALRRTVAEAGFVIEVEHVFGNNPHGPYTVARNPGGAGRRTAAAGSVESRINGAPRSGENNVE